MTASTLRHQDVGIPVFFFFKPHNRVAIIDHEHRQSCSHSYTYSLPPESSTVPAIGQITGASTVQYFRMLLTISHAANTFLTH